MTAAPGPQHVKMPIAEVAHLCVPSCPACAAPGPQQPDEVLTGVELIAAERRRQVDQEGWTPEHDAEHAGEGLALAACCYAVPPQMRKHHTRLADGRGNERGDRYRAVPTLWPWHPDYWKPCADDRVRELVKAGALIAAEIDRLRPAAPSAQPDEVDGTVETVRLAQEGAHGPWCNGYLIGSCDCATRPPAQPVRDTGEGRR